MEASKFSVLGIEGGATHTTVLWVGDGDSVLRKFSLGPANVLLLTDAELCELFQEVKQGIDDRIPDAVCIGLAGVRGEKEAERVQAALEQCWPGIPSRVTDDLETALAAGEIAADAEARVLVLSGTGSCCFGRNREGAEAKVGGRGHILGDRGSSCDIGLQGLRAAVADFDHTGIWPGVGEAILASLQINDLESLIPWSIEAGKHEIASLAIPVFEAAQNGCPIALRIVEEAAERLAHDALACSRKLSGSGVVQFLLAGGTLRKQPEFAGMVASVIRQSKNGAVIDVLERAGTWGAVALAKGLVEGGARQSGGTVFAEEQSLVVDLKKSPTEQRNPLSMNLDKLTISEAVDLMISEDRKLPDAILAEKDKIVRLVEQVVASFESGGRLFYVGAGTSGRLGVLDASECPPTFQSPAEQVQGIIAGGYRALWSPIEGAEDDPAAGRKAVCFRGVDDKDTVLGIAASGRTPFVHGALVEAGERGASTALLCFNPTLEISGNHPETIICPEIGPEILTGSTRLKAGTATKMVLNMVTTLAMVQTGKVISNLMVDVNASNDKLRDRAVRITIELTGADEMAVAEALHKSGWSIRDACLALQ
ncbi:MAG: N-acetylmuramic acid 6-phosphate etherase [Verrucomicrobiales bacterium]|nr:N-acetylmuramic acid 6-phosphate etherase [Verrucomicrobiales bacterium]